MLRFGVEPPGRYGRGVRAFSLRRTAIHDATKSFFGFLESGFGSYRSTARFVATLAKPHRSWNSRWSRVEKRNQLAAVTDFVYRRERPVVYHKTYVHRTYSMVWPFEAPFVGGISIISEP